MCCQAQHHLPQAPFCLKSVPRLVPKWHTPHAVVFRRIQPPEMTPKIGALEKGGFSIIPYVARRAANFDQKLALAIEGRWSSPFRITMETLFVHVMNTAPEAPPKIVHR